MKKLLVIVAIAGVFTACGNNNESSSSSDSTATSITPPSTADSTSEMAPMMGDTAKATIDSVR
ncbi:hypothetical protein GXP67_11835 [Rhodocytophaga rosea]|uniref:Coproporphyrinogen III oxidase n=1 Tax=Rhodocytophaga rosea TaxID=2704465 RepID=A0A6C0GH09_9BACT|nr:hypothetical protein [Rhodocytophaga rosea]QHT67278.1 hypothetical protein GXP67_11835 [Rhodocytophaga rosea]